MFCDNDVVFYERFIALIFYNRLSTRENVTIPFSSFPFYTRSYCGQKNPIMSNETIQMIAAGRTK